MKTVFSDGMKFETSGEYRIKRERDGLYVVGNGLLCPIDTRTEGALLIARLTSLNVELPQKKTAIASRIARLEAKVRSEKETAK